MEAKQIKRLPPSASGAEQYVWELSTEIPYGYDGDKGTTKYVVTSAVSAMFSGPETYIFPSTVAGEILDWGELPGSYKGGFDHQRAIDGLCECTTN